MIDGLICLSHVNINWCAANAAVVAKHIYPEEQSAQKLARMKTEKRGRQERKRKGENGKTPRDQRESKRKNGEKSQVINDGTSVKVQLFREYKHVPGIR